MLFCRIISGPCAMCFALLAMLSVHAAQAQQNTAPVQNANAPDSAETGQGEQTTSPTFVGHTVTVKPVFPDPSKTYHDLGTQVVASSGTSFKGIAFTVTVNASQIVISNQGPSLTHPKGSVIGYQIGTTFGTPLISGVTIRQANNGFDSSGVTFDASDIYLDFQGLTNPPGVDVVVDVQFAPSISVEPPTPDEQSGPAVPTAGVNGYGFPSCVYCPEPRFTDAALKARAQGTVILSAVIGTDGRATRIKLAKGLGYGMDDNAASAVQTWRFKPATAPDGKPAAVRAELKFRFAST